MKKVLPRVLRLTFVAGLCAGLSACDQKDASADALQKAHVQLAALTPFGTPSASPKFKADTYNKVISSLQSVSHDGTTSQKASASLLIAQSQAGLAEPASARMGEFERTALNHLSGIRSRLGQYLSQSSSAAAAASYDPSKELADIEKSDKEKADQIKAEQVKKADVDKKASDLRTKAQAKADEARTKQAEAGVEHQKVPNQTAIEGEKSLLQARNIARRADALEVEAASLEAEASRISPEALEIQNSIDRLNKQRDLLAKERGEISKRNQAAKGEAAAMRADAAKTADEIKKAVAEIEELRGGDLKTAVDEATKGYKDAAVKAKSAAQEMKSTAQMTVATANQALADVQLSQAQGLNAFAQVLDSLAAAKPALPDADKYKAKCDEAKAAAKEAVEAARESYKTADAAYGAAGATGESKTRLEKVNQRLRELVKATGGDPELIPSRGEVAPETPAAPSEATPAAGTTSMDLSTPQGTLQAMLDISKAQNYEAAADLFLTSSDSEKQTLRGLMGLTPKFKKLDEATKAKFGQSFLDMSKQMGGQMGTDGFDLSKFKDVNVADVPVKVEGDTATCAIPGGNPLVLKQKDGKWLVDMSAMGIQTAQLAMVGQLMGGMNKAVDELTAEVEAGKHKDLQAVMQALGQKLMQVPNPGGG